MIVREFWTFWVVARAFWVVTNGLGDCDGVIGGC